MTRTKPTVAGDEPEPSVKADSAGRASDVHEIVAAWLDDLGRVGTGASRPDTLLEAYRAFGEAVVREGLVDGSDGGAAPEREKALTRTLGRVVSEVRRAGLGIADALADLDRLKPVAVRRIRQGTGADGVDAPTLDGVLGVLSAIDSVARTITRVLERRAVRAEREQSEALAAMTDQLSHELRNRLGAARTAGQMLMNPDIDLDEAGRARVAALVEKSVEAALHTVGDVRSLHSRRSSGSPPEVRSAPLPHLIRRVVEDLSPAALDAGVDVRVEGDVVDCEVDAALLRLVVFNLVGNGIKYRDPERDAPTVWIRTRRSASGEVELEVQDNGVGIEDDELEDIFLDRVRGSDTHDVPGSGVGLAIVEEAIGRIDGTIAVESEVGVGSTFTVRFEPLG